MDSKYDTIILSEAKALLWDLIVTSHDQSHVALASADHLRYMSKYINENTKHMYYVWNDCYFVHYTLLTGSIDTISREVQLPHNI